MNEKRNKSNAACALNDALLCFKMMRETTDCNDIQSLVDAACLYVQSAMNALAIDVEVKPNRTVEE